MPGAKSPIRPSSGPDAAGPPSELAETYRRHSGWLHQRLRRRLGSAADADDLVQEAYARAVEIERTHRIRHPQALLLRIAVRLVVDHARRAKRLSPLSDADAERIAAPAEQESEVLLKQIILALPPRLRDVFVLSRLAGLSYEQIARELGVSVKTVEARMSKALTICAARLGDAARK